MIVLNWTAEADERYVEGEGYFIIDAVVRVNGTEIARAENVYIRDDDYLAHEAVELIKGLLRRGGA